jgi:methionine-rich copper-binding protein CopC
MTKSKWFAGAMVVLLASVAQAHTHLKAAVPAQGSTVKSSPQNIELTFSAPARITALTIQKEGGKEQKISPLPTESAARLSVPAPQLSAGKYVLNWRVVGADNHVMSGKLDFTIDPSATPAAGKAPAHDHH